MFEDKNIKTQDFKALATPDISSAYTGPASEAVSSMSIKSLGQAPWWQWLALAAIILSIAGLVWWYLHKPSTKALLDPVAPVVNNQTTPVDNADNAVTADPNLDTDADGLTDVAETTVWFTDPTLADTDADGYSDGAEVANGYNPLGAGKLSDQANNATPSDPAVVASAQGVLDNFAKSINEKNGQNFLKLLAPANKIYAQAQADPTKFLTFFASYYQDQTVSFSVKSATQTENKITASVDTLLANSFFENTSFVLEKINNEWKVLE